MRETPRERAESPQEQYARLLARGISVQKEYGVLEKRVTALYREGVENEAEVLSKDARQLEDRMGSLLQQRVDLIREIEHLKTIEDVFPRVKRAPEEERSEAHATQLIQMFKAGKLDANDLRAAAKKMESDDLPDLTDREREAYKEARLALALEMGYEKASESVGWFEMERNGVGVSMKQFPFRSGFSITGDDRISTMTATKADERVLYYDNGWTTACTDPEVQKEIDRAIAIFG